MPTEDGTVIRRRRECTSCSKRFTTYEKIEDIPLMIVKKSGQREQYDRNKIMNGIIKACEKSRPISIKEIEDTVDKIEKEIYQSLTKKYPRRLLVKKIMDHLKDMDDVAYVRFASVYRQFKDGTDRNASPTREPSPRPHGGCRARTGIVAASCDGCCRSPSRDFPRTSRPCDRAPRASAF